MDLHTGKQDERWEPDTLRHTVEARGDRVRPVHKPWGRQACVWVRGIGWVLNPSRHEFK